MRDSILNEIIRESKNKYQNEAKVIFRERRHCIQMSIENTIWGTGWLLWGKLAFFQNSGCGASL